MRHLFFISLFCCMSVGMLADIKDLQRGDSLRDIGLFTEAIDCYNKVEAKNMSQKNRLWQALAHCHKNTGDYQQAIIYHERLLELQVQQDRKNKVLLNLSDLWLLTGQYEKVIDALEGKTFNEGEGIRIVNLSSAYLRMNRPNDALAMLDIAIGNCGTAMTDVCKAAMQNKGYILWALRRYDEADEALEVAYVSYDDTSRDKYVCGGNLAIVKAELGHYQDALELIDSVIDWQKAHLGINHIDYIISIRKKAEILLGKGDKEEAVRWFKEYFEKERNYIADNFICMTEKERQDLWYTHSPLIAECYATEETDPDFLMDVAVFSKSVLMQANANIKRLADSSTELADKYARLRTLRFKLRNADDVETRKEADRLERELTNSIKDADDFKKTLSLGIDDVAVNLKGNDRIVEFIKYDKKDHTYYAALVKGKATKAKFIPLFSSEDVEKHLADSKIGKDALTSMQNKVKDMLLADTVLGRMIWQPVLKEVPQNASIYFTPDGWLYLLGIEYMCFDRKDVRIYRLTSAYKLCDTKTNSKGNSALLVGGLDYENTSAVKESDSPNRSAGNMLFKNMGFTSSNKLFSNLKGSLAEVDSVYNIMNGKYKCDTLKYEKGTEQAVKDAIPDNSIILMSTHGFCLDYEMPARLVYAKDSISEDLSLQKSGLAMSGVNNCAKPYATNNNIDDGILTAMEICDVNLRNADMVILSACQSGLGRVTADGAIGLPRGFKKAGANSLLVSLWYVDDEATRLLVTRFMQNIKAGKSKHEAFREAQTYLRSYETEVTESQHTNVISRIRDQREGTENKTVKTKRITKYSAPRYWAAFILLDGLD